MSYPTNENEYRPGACPLDPGPVQTLQPWMIIADLTRERDEARAVLLNLMPYVLEDYVPDWATPGFKSAVEAAIAIVGAGKEGA